jgi:hypothetical protein
LRADDLGRGRGSRDQEVPDKSAADQAIQVVVTGIAPPSTSAIAIGDTVTNTSESHCNFGGVTGNVAADSSNSRHHLVRRQPVSHGARPLGHARPSTRPAHWSACH